MPKQGANQSRARAQEFETHLSNPGGGRQGKHKEHLQGRKLDSAGILFASSHFLRIWLRRGFLDVSCSTSEPASSAVRLKVREA